MLINGSGVGLRIHQGFNLTQKKQNSQTYTLKKQYKVFGVKCWTNGFSCPQHALSQNIIDSCDDSIIKTVARTVVLMDGKISCEANVNY